jgi:regulator of replication initiation timing
LLVADSNSLQSDAAVDELKTELHSLVEELNALSMRNDELMAEREQDAQGMNEMEAKVEEYKRKYDAVRIELRNLKGESKRSIEWSQ